MPRPTNDGYSMDDARRVEQALAYPRYEYEVYVPSAADITDPDTGVPILFGDVLGFLSLDQLRRAHAALGRRLAAIEEADAPPDEVSA